MWYGTWLIKKIKAIIAQIEVLATEKWMLTLAVVGQIEKVEEAFTALLSWKSSFRVNEGNGSFKSTVRNFNSYKFFL
jgi:hypothetical protein